MSNEFFIKPAQDNLIVRDPVTMQPLKPYGESKPRNSYWLRRERDRDVVQTNPDNWRAATKSASKSSKKTEGEKS